MASSELFTPWPPAAVSEPDRPDYRNDRKPGPVPGFSYPNDGNGMAYKRWITNCTADDAFSYLMRYSAENPDKSYTIGRPHPAGPSEFVVYNIGLNGTYIPIRTRSDGYTVEQLESFDYRAIYELVDDPYLRDRSDI